MSRFRLLAVLGTVLAGILASGCASAFVAADQRDDWVEKWLDLPASALAETTVAIIDGGLRAHPVLAGKVVDAWEAEKVAGLPRTSHGTAMAGLVLGATRADSAAITKGVQVLDVRVLDDTGFGEPADVAAGVRWAVGHGADLILMSMSLSVNDTDLGAAVAEAIESGTTVIASTTNGFSESPSYPAEYPGVIGVTSVSADLSLAPLAGTRGADVAAPGHDVAAPSAPRGFREISGTSVAAATATSVIASCFHDRDHGESSVIAYAKNSGATVASDQLGIPLLRCLTEGT